MKMKQIQDETVVGYDGLGNEIKAERLQKWAYHQLSVTPELLEALNFFLEEDHSDCIPRGGCPAYLRGVENAKRVIAKVEGK